MTDDQEKSEHELIELVRTGGPAAFVLTITCTDSRWKVQIDDHEGPGASTAGEGATFHEAWSNLEPRFGE
jgi:hypothetical protein